jgi:tetratricopeptide (TPR) repeat protein
LLLAVALAPSVGAAAAADPKGVARYKKSEREVEGVPQTQLTKPAPPPKEAKQTGPVMSLEEFTGQRTERIQKLTDQQIGQMQRLIRVTEDDDPQKADFYFRLAELYAEKQRYFFFQTHSLDQKIFDAQGGQKAALQRQQQGYEQEQQKWLLQAVATYIEASKFRKYPKMDEVLFKLAYLLQTVKREDQAREFFHRLIKDYPNSKYVPEAYLSFGEYFFQKGEMDAALKFYERVEQFPKSPIYGYAVYKKGWCYINLSDFRKALEIFVDVINIARTNRGGEARQNKALEREAKKDVVKAFGRMPGANADKAWEFFQRVGGDFAPKMMELLGELYWEQGMFADSTRVYRKIIETNKGSPRICEWQDKVVRNTLSQGTKRDQVQELGRLGLAYQYISKMQNVKKDVMAECRNTFHDKTKELALVWHKEAQKTKNPDTYQLTKYVYKIYLENFPREKGGLDMAFYYAEVLWVTESWKEAAEQYTKVVEMDPKSKYVKESAYAAVLAWKNYLNIDDAGSGPEDKRLQDEKTLKVRPIPEYQQKMIAAFDTYIKYVPDSDMLVKIKYRKARIYYEYNHFDDAVRLFKDIVDHHGKDELAVYSANLMLDSLNAQGKTKEVIAWVDKFITNPDLMKDPQFQKDMVTLKIDSLDLEGHRESDAGNYKECGISFLAAAESMPDHPKHAERLYNAGQCFQNARLIGRAIGAREELIKTHPKDPLAQMALYRIAAGWHQLASYTRAAEFYEQFATKFPGEKESVIALNNAYTFRIGLGNWNEAEKDIENFVRFYGDKKPQQAADVFYQKGEIYEKQNKTDELVRHLNNYISRWGNKGTPDKTMIAHFRLGEIAWKKSCPKSEGVNGACIEIKRVTATGRQKAFYDINKKIKDKRKKIKGDVRTQCGPPTHAKITVFDRNRSVVKQAQDHFDKVLKLWRSDAKKVAADRLPAAAYAAAGSAFYQAEVLYEDLLRIKFPEGLDFQKPSSYDSKRKADAKKKKQAESAKRFLAYMTEKGKLANRLAGVGDGSRALYGTVTEFKSAHWTVAAAARIGQVWSNFVDQLYTAEIPKDLKEQDEWGNRPREIFCDELVDQAEPIETKAIKAYGLCLQAATQESWFNEWSNLCEVELNQMQPSEYPLAVEAKPEPGFVPVMMTPAPVQQELPSQIQATPVVSQKE